MLRDSRLLCVVFIGVHVVGTTHAGLFDKPLFPNEVETKTKAPLQMFPMPTEIPASSTKAPFQMFPMLTEIPASSTKGSLFTKKPMTTTTNERPNESQATSDAGAVSTEETATAPFQMFPMPTEIPASSTKGSLFTKKPMTTTTSEKPNESQATSDAGAVSTEETATEPFRMFIMPTETPTTTTKGSLFAKKPITTTTHEKLNDAEPATEESQTPIDAGAVSTDKTAAGDLVTAFAVQAASSDTETTTQDNIFGGQSPLFPHTGSVASEPETTTKGSIFAPKLTTESNIKDGETTTRRSIFAPMLTTDSEIKDGETTTRRSIFAPKVIESDLNDGETTTRRSIFAPKTTDSDLKDGETTTRRSIFAPKTTDSDLKDGETTTRRSIFAPKLTTDSTMESGETTTRRSIFAPKVTSDSDMEGETTTKFNLFAAFTKPAESPTDGETTTKFNLFEGFGEKRNHSGILDGNPLTNNNGPLNLFEGFGEKRNNSVGLFEGFGEKWNQSGNPFDILTKKQNATGKPDGNPLINKNDPLSIYNNFVESEKERVKQSKNKKFRPLGGSSMRVAVTGIVEPLKMIADGLAHFQDSLVVRKDSVYPRLVRVGMQSLFNATLGQIPLIGPKLRNDLYEINMLEPHPESEIKEFLQSRFGKAQGSARFKVLTDLLEKLQSEIASFALSITQITVFPPFVHGLAIVEDHIPPTSIDAMNAMIGVFKRIQKTSNSLMETLLS